MALEPGTRLAHYEITDLIGKGGMGEVYRARDTKLGREVAIKVLPSEFARDAERLARLEREARMLAALNHPNIAAIYGLEESDERFLVLELVEGDTLADRLKRGAIPVEESLELALQIAQALEAAHEKGVIHRDLKPANVKITPDGRIKVLDFGLAKAFIGDQANVNLSDSPTLSVVATRQGVVLGTVGYMSPEQAAGDLVDIRADIWAFGVVLFEMLTGRSPFEGETVSHVLAGVLRTDPDWSGLPSGLHPRVRVVLERCLEKDLRNRCRDMSEARVAISRALEDPAGAVLETGPAAVRSRAYLIGAFALGLLVSGLAVWSLKPSDAVLPDVVRFSHVLPPGQRLAQSNAPISIQFDVAPGGQVVYAANEQLYMRRLDEREAFAIPGSGDEPMTPAFSPDGQWIAYWSRMTEELRKIPAAGGTAETLVSVPAVAFLGGPSGISWDTDDTLLYTTPEGIWTVPAGGGEAQLRLPSDEDLFILKPQVLPGQTRVLYSEIRPSPEGARARVRVASLDDGKRTTLFEGAFARYLDTGHLVYTRENALFATRFDPVTLEFENSSRQLAGGFRTALGFVSYAVSDDARTLALDPAPGSTPEGPPGGRTIVWVNREGVEEFVPVEPGSWLNVRVSPSGTQLALRNGDQQIYTWRVDTGPLRAFAQSSTPPVWLNDGEMVFLGPGGIVRRSIDSSDQTVVADGETLPGFVFEISSFSPSENALVLEFQGGASEIQLLSLDELSYRPVIEGQTLAISDAQLSRDGSHIALQENTTEITIREFPDVQATAVSVGNGIHPLWTGAGIYYQRQGAIWLRPVETNPELELGRPERLVGMEGYAPSGFSGRSWDVAPDGRLVVVKLPEEGTDAETSDPPADPERQEIYIVVNFDRQLLEQVPLP